MEEVFTKNTERILNFIWNWKIREPKNRRNTNEFVNLLSHTNIFFCYLCNHIHSNNWCNYWNILWKESLNTCRISTWNKQIDWWCFSSSASNSFHETLNVIIYFRIIFNLILTGGVFQFYSFCVHLNTNME